MGHPTSFFARFYSFALSSDVRAFIILNLSFGFIPDGGLDIQKCPCGHTKSTFHTIFGSTEQGWSPLGGHMLRQDSNDLAYVDCIHYTVLERWIANGSFNLECMAEGEYSCSTTILIILNPNKQGTVLKCMSIGLIVQRRNGPVGRIDDIPKLIACMLVLN